MVDARKLFLTYRPVALYNEQRTQFCVDTDHEHTYLFCMRLFSFQIRMLGCYETLISYVTNIMMGIC
jgi:hypothetical protein